MSKLNAIFYHDFANSYIPHILKEIYIDKVYEPYVRNKHFKTVVDCGANIGLTAAYFSNYADKVYAVEPSEIHQTAISAMVKQNDITNIIPVPAAIADKTGQVTFYHNQNVTMYSLKQAVSQGEEEVVQAYTMEDFMKAQKIDRIDLMKLDIEGAEMDVIVSDGFAKVADKIDLILGEFHTWTEVNPEQFANVLRDYGYKFTWMNNTEASTFVAERIC